MASIWGEKLFVLLLAAAAETVSAHVSVKSELHWYRGNTHTHTINSDGDSAPDVVVRWYREHDYQFLFLTDHEYVTDAAPLNAEFGASERFLVLPGQEITQWGEDPKRSSAHVNNLFATKVIFPVGARKCIGSGCGAYAAAAVPLAGTLKANINAIREQGGLPQVNHPNYRWSVKPEDLYGIPDGTLLEVWNGQGHINNLGGDDGAGDVRPSAEGDWDILLSRGKIIWGVGSDDAHDFQQPGVDDPDGAAPGQAWIMVHAPELSAKAIRESLEDGDFYASTGPTLDDVKPGPTTYALIIHEEKPGAQRYVTRFIGQGGNVLAEVAGANPRYRLTGHETYVRADVTDSNGKRAWTQPEFLDQRARMVGRLRR